ncbi:hypothetical protein BDV95DRAFT_628543 [Massariosphaeria phaeospora]|uniref:Uncharacterized protein n=1 Tax=Massariosphaeria phaeospora TaxID=100035 RepID=A0A7C8MFL7_9PLEO|nr:hypothetical protein BDV95DRAFT_628543 [Massariosphaeria phaeospora]
MQRQTWWLLLLLTFVSFLSTALAASPTSFCKCTCFGNSTIVALDAPVASQKPSPLKDRASKKSCSDCNRQFCLSYTFCQGEKEENVFTTCFQRDSAKDQAVVFIFIFATVGLLSYAAIRPWIEQWTERARERHDYIPVSGQGNQ